MSTVNDSDWVLINRGTSSYKCAAGDVKAKATSSDYMLVNRGSSSYKIQGPDFKSKIVDSDWILVNRGSSSYKCSGADFKKALGPAKSEVWADAYYWGNNGNNNINTGVNGDAYKSTAIIHSVGTKSIFTIGCKGVGSASNGDYAAATPSNGRGATVNWTENFNTYWGPGNVYLKAGTGAYVNQSGTAYTMNHLRQAEGFHDWQKYSGNNGTQRIYHNLGEVPGAVIVIGGFRSQYTAWHNKSSSVVHCVGTSSSNSGPDSSYNESFIYSSGTKPINAVTSTYIDITNENNHINSSGYEYLVLFFGGGGNGNDLIKCGQFTGNGSTSSGPTITMDFAPNFFLQWRADTYPTQYGYHSSGRLAAIKADNTIPGFAVRWDLTAGSVDISDSDLKLVKSWNSNGVTIERYYVFGINDSGVKYNYIAF